MAEDPHPFLAAYDWGVGRLWGVFLAGSSEAIARQCPELVVVADRPGGMSVDDLAFAELARQINPGIPWWSEPA